MQRIGVFVCHCGSNIASTVDVKSLAEEIKSEEGVVFSADYQYMCSESGQRLIKNAIAEHSLSGAVVCSCSPRMHEQTFRSAAAQAGLNEYMVEIANIREQCSWIHSDKSEATKKAAVLIRAAIEKLRRAVPLKAGETPVTKRCLVIGGGVAGIQTALDIADAGFKVDIVEKKPSIGGKMAQLDKTFPTLDCSACILTPKTVEASRHENITLYAYSEIEAVEGFVGNFTVKIRKKARYINETLCSGCGVCTQKCPSRKGRDEFNMGLSARGAVYIPFAQAVPNVPVIDAERCIHFKTGKCGLCEKSCEAHAVDFSQTDSVFEEKYGAIVVATGFDMIKPTAFGEYGYGKYPDVVTSLELERLMNAAGPTGGHLKRPSDGRQPRKIVFLQCVGSRDKTARGKEYCSKICCMYTAKHAMLIREKYPDTSVTVFYIDVRTPGKGYDEFYMRAVSQYGVRYIKGAVGKIYDENGGLKILASDLITGEKLCLDADMAVLACATKPDESARELATLLTASVDTNGFFTEAHAKLRPSESPTAGVFLSGFCAGPRDIPDTVASAGAAAAKVIGLLSKNSLTTNPCVAHSAATLCSGCKNCEKVCPYGAISYAEQTVNMPEGRQTRTVAVVNEAVCHGCGACTVACPSAAMDLKGFSNSQIMSQIDAICLR